MQIRPEIPVLPYQKQFSEFGIKNPFRFALLLAGYAAGKSKALPFRILNLIKHRVDKADILVVAPTQDLAEEINYEDLQETLDTYKFRYKIYRRRKMFVIGSGHLKGRVRFRSANHPEKIVGFNATDFIIDEFDINRVKSQEMIWRKCIARIRKTVGATGGVTTTPEGFKYTYQLFEKGVLRPNGERRPVGITYRARTTDNPFVPQDYIDSLYQLYPKKVVRQYINAQYVNIAGDLAYWGFQRDLNVIAPIQPVSRQLHVGIDFNVSPMTAVIGLKISDKLIIFDYIYLKPGNTYRLCEVLKERYPGYEILTYPDLTGIKRSTSAASVNINDLKILSSYGFKLIGNDNGSVRGTLLTTNKAFEDRRLLVTENCTRVIEDLEQVITDNQGNIIKDDDDKTHLSDGVRYTASRIFPSADNRPNVRRW